MSADVAIVGLGVTGSAIAAELAGRGLRVVGLDRWTPPHAHGASHGRTRIIREAYFEDPLYVPWVRRARDGWAELEAWRGRTLLLPCPVLTLAPREPGPGQEPVPETGRPEPERTGPEASGLSLARAALDSARQHGVETHVLEAPEIARRYTALAPPDDYIGILDPRGGILLVERCLEALHARAIARGAELRCGTRVLGIEGAGDGVVVVTGSGRISAARVVLAAGARVAQLLTEPAPFTVERQTVHWYAPAAGSAAAVGADALPVTLWQLRDGSTFYAIPDIGEGLKSALHHGGPVVDPDAPAAPVSEAEWRNVEARLRACVPAAGERIRAEPCLYTNTPDGHFVIDVHPSEPRLLVASACSGHGFKFAPAIAAAVAAWATGATFPLDTGPFRLARPAITGAAQAHAVDRVGHGQAGAVQSQAASAEQP